MEGKLDELIELLAQSKLDTEKVKKYKEKIGDALDAATDKDPFSPFRKLADESLSREDMLDKMSLLLSENKIDSKTPQKLAKRKLSERIALGAVSIVIITLGFAMIIMPAPSAEFEIYTVFYFTPDDGVTVMDLISLLIILSGVFLLIVSFNAHKISGNEK